MAENKKKSWLQAWNAAAKAAGKASAGTGNPAPAKEKEYGADLREKMEAQKLVEQPQPQETVRTTQTPQTPSKAADAWRAEVHHQAEQRAAEDKKLQIVEAGPGSRNKAQQKASNFVEALQAVKRKTEAEKAALPVGVNSNATQGSCGKNLRWRLRNGLLEISGTGDMNDYLYQRGDSTSPWNRFSHEIHKVIIQNGVTGIGDHAFLWLDHLTDITIPDSVTHIGKHAFQACFALKTISIPAGITIIPEGVFMWDAGIERIKLPDGICEIQSNAFADCKQMTCITFPGSLRKLTQSAFSGCEQLKDIIYKGTLEQWAAIVGSNALAARLPDTKLSYMENGSIHNSVVLNRVEQTLEVKKARLAEQKRQAAQRAEEQRLAMEKKRAEAAARQAEEQRLAAEKAAREAAERLEQHEKALAVFQEQLKKQTDALPPVGREIATQQGQRQLFDALAVVIPKLAKCKEPPHRAARLYTEQLDDLDALFTAVSGVLTGTARILSGTGLETAAEQWPARSDAELLMGYKALRCYAELSEYPDEFNAAADLLAETLQEREEARKQKAQEAAAAQQAAEAQTQQPEEMPSAGEPKSPSSGMLQALLSSGENLEKELLASDPGELKRIIRAADSAERRSLMELLDRALQKAEGEQKELLKIVYDFADGVQKADAV